MNKSSLILSSKILRSLDLEAKYTQAEEEAFKYALGCWEFDKKTKHIPLLEVGRVRSTGLYINGLSWNSRDLKDVRFISDETEYKLNEVDINLTDLATIIHQMLYPDPLPAS